MLSKYWTITSKPQIQADSNIFLVAGEDVQIEGCVIKNTHLTINPNQKPLFTDVDYDGKKDLLINLI